MDRRGVTGRIVKAPARVIAAEMLDAATDAARLRADACAELERARSEAEAIRRDAVQAGYAEGCDRAASELVELIATTRAEANAALEAAAASALPLAVKMAERIVGDAVALDPSRLNGIVQAALATSRARSGRVVLRVHPADRQALEASKPTLVAALPAVQLSLVDDERVGRGGCVVETPSGRVDARLATQLAVLERAVAARLSPGRTT